WTDSRYFVQAEEQLKGSGFELVKLKTQGAAEYASWLKDSLRKGSTVAFDGKLIAVATAQHLKETLEPNEINVKANVDLIEEIWRDRPGLPLEKAFILTKEQTGKTIDEKIKEVKQSLKEKG